MWTSMKDDIARQHIKIRNDLRKQFQQEQGSAADLLYESTRLFKPITETTEKIKKAIVARDAVPVAAQPLPVAEAAAPAPPIAALPQVQAQAIAAAPYAIIDPDQGLDIQAIEQMGFIRPSRLKDYDAYDDIIEKVGRYNKHVLGPSKRGSTSEEKDDISEKINANRQYVKRLRLILSGQKLLVEGRGMLVGNKFGNLTIDRNELDLGRLKASKNGTIVINEPADRSLYNLLTKRYSKKHKYSCTALKTFKKLMELADIGSKQSAAAAVGGAIYYNDPNDLVDRLQLLVASQEAGNTGVNNDISDIIDELLKKAYISKDVAIKLYNNLL